MKRKNRNANAYYSQARNQGRSRPGHNLRDRECITLDSPSPNDDEPEIELEMSAMQDSSVLSVKALAQRRFKICPILSDDDIELEMECVVEPPSQALIDAYEEAEKRYNAYLEEMGRLQSDPDVIIEDASDMQSVFPDGGQDSYSTDADMEEVGDTILYQPQSTSTRPSPNQTGRKRRQYELQQPTPLTAGHNSNVTVSVVSSNGGPSSARYLVQNPTPSNPSGQYLLMPDNTIVPILDPKHPGVSVQYGMAPQLSIRNYSSSRGRGRPKKNPDIRPKNNPDIPISQPSTSLLQPLFTANETKQITDQIARYYPDRGVEKSKISLNSLADFSEPSSQSFSCTMCEKSVNNLVLLMRHCLNHILFRSHSDVEASLELSQLTRCADCYQGFKTPYELQLHKNKVHLQPDYLCVCQICDVQFPSPKALLSHLSGHHETNSAPYTCSVCKSYKTPFHAELLGHFIKCQEGRERSKALCFFCLKTYQVPPTGNYLWHLQSHMNRRNHRCSRCRLKFLTDKELKLHLLTSHHMGGGKDGGGEGSASTAVRSGGGGGSGSSGGGGVRSEGGGVRSGGGGGGSGSSGGGGVASIRSAGSGGGITSSVPSVGATHTPLISKSSSERAKPPQTVSCIECKRAIHDKHHFGNSTKCSWCPLVTNCRVNWMNHIHMYHQDSVTPSTKSQMLFYPYKPVPVSCLCPCGYSSDEGNKMAMHMYKAKHQRCAVTSSQDQGDAASEVDDATNYFQPAQTLSPDQMPLRRRSNDFRVVSGGRGGASRRTANVSHPYGLAGPGPRLQLASWRWHDSRGDGRTAGRGPMYIQTAEGSRRLLPRPPVGPPAQTPEVVTIDDD